jgi:transposase-like protein
MASFEFLAIILTGLGLTASIFYYAMVLRNTNKSRLRDVIFQRAQVYSSYYTESFAATRNMTDWDTVEEFKAKYGISVNPEKWSKYMYITRVFNIAGILLKENMADADLIFKLYPPYAVINVWEQFEPVTQNLREFVNYPEAYDSFEFLYNQAKQRYPEIIHHPRESQ